MSLSTEYKLERIVMLVLTVSPILAADLRHQDDDADTIEAASRIVVKCDPPVPHLAAKNAGETPPVMEALINVTAMGAVDQTSTDFDAWCAAIDAALSGPSYPADAITQAGIDFPLGLVLDQPTQGFRWEGATDHRTRTRGVRAIYRP